MDVRGNGRSSYLSQGDLIVVLFDVIIEFYRENALWKGRGGLLLASGKRIHAQNVDFDPLLRSRYFHVEAGQCFRREDQPTRSAINSVFFATMTSFLPSVHFSLLHFIFLYALCGL